MGEKNFAGPAHGSAFLLYNSQTYCEDEDASAGGIPTYGLEVNGDRLLQNDLRVGGSLSYLMGSEEIDDVNDTDQEHTQSRWHVAVQLSWTG